MVNRAVTWVYPILTWINPTSTWVEPKLTWVNDALISAEARPSWGSIPWNVMERL